MSRYCYQFDHSEVLEESLDTIKMAAKMAAIERLGLPIHDFSSPSPKYGSLKESHIYSHGPRAAGDHILEFILNGFSAWNQRQDFLSWEEGIGFFAAHVQESLRLGYEQACALHEEAHPDVRKLLEETLDSAHLSLHSWKESLIQIE